MGRHGKFCCGLTCDSFFLSCCAKGLFNSLTRRTSPPYLSHLLSAQLFSSQGQHPHASAAMFGRNKQKSNGVSTLDTPSKSEIKRATRTRLIWSLIASFLLLISLVFLILVELGNTRINPTLNKIYFIKLDLSNIIPVNVPNAVLINSIARTPGLHDFYTVGLWGFCEGYNGEGVTECSKPETLYWFNPVEILQQQLLAGATSMSPESPETFHEDQLTASPQSPSQPTSTKSSTSSASSPNGCLASSSPPRP